MTQSIPTCRWGIITTGLISSWFVEDLLIPRSNAKAKHVVAAIGSSSVDKARSFADKWLANQEPKPSLHGSYDEVYALPDIDCVYIGSPHGFHKRDMLAAISCGKNILCEKAFTLNAAEAREVLDAAKAKGVYVGEAMWLRHRPLIAGLRQLLYKDNVIGDIYRMTSHFGLDIDIANLPATSRYKNLKLGAGSLLDLGIYPLTWALVILDSNNPYDSERPSIHAAQSFIDDVEVTTSVIMRWGSSGRQGIISSTTNAKSNDPYVAYIEGSKGYIEVHGPAPSLPLTFMVYPKRGGAGGDSSSEKPQGKKYDFEMVGRGFIYEADNTALDIAQGKTESDVMPWKEILRVMEIMDEIRKQGGTRYEVDAEDDGIRG